MAKVLVTGSTGFIGRRLVYQLLKEGHEVYAQSRLRGTGLVVSDRLFLLYGDMRHPEKMDPFPEDIEAAYYLVHSLSGAEKDLLEEEKEVAHTFVEAIEKTQCRQIIFLSGIIEQEKRDLSPHLASRLAVEKILQESRIPSTTLRSSIIIGSGSASFEILRDLAEKLPLMIAPKWVKSLCQPISIQDVLFYLSAILLLPASYQQTYDIGGPRALSFKELLLEYAAFRGLKRYIIDVALLTPRLSSLWLLLITSVRFSICRYLVESMKQNTRKLNLAIDLVVPHTCLTYPASLELAFQKIAQNEVFSTWMDAWDVRSQTGDIKEFIEVPEKGCLKDIKVVKMTQPVDKVQRKIWSLGGHRGWYSMNWAWRVRGLMDKLVGGTGLNRGRRHPYKLLVGDSVDFWRVLLADEQNRHLILYAEMKLPGEAWLEFKINSVDNTLLQTATFRPRGFLGRLYWYLFLPFHWIIFKNMAITLAQKETLNI